MQEIQGNPSKSKTGLNSDYYLLLRKQNNAIRSFNDFTFSADKEQVNRVSAFNYLGVVLDEKCKWKMHVNSLLQKLGIASQCSTESIICSIATKKVSQRIFIMALSYHT